MTAEETRAHKAKQFRYKKQIVAELNLETIQSELWDMKSVCEDIHWYDGDIESLVSALNGDEEEAYEFKMAFSCLEAELDQFEEDLNDAWIPEYFDLFFPAIGAGEYAGGMMGYDSFEGDYFGLTPYEYQLAEEEAVKKMTALTKKELLEAAGACLKIAYQYMAIRFRYDCMEAAIEVLRGENADRIKAVKGIEEQYQIAEKESDHFRYKYNPDVRKLDEMLKLIPQEYWVS